MRSPLAEGHAEDGEIEPADVDAAAHVPELDFAVGQSEAGERLDKALASRMPEVSRSRLKSWIEAGAVRVNGAEVKPRYLLQSDDRVELEPPIDPEASAFQPERMPLEVVYEDASVLVIDKPAGLVMHPAAGHWSGTLLNGLLAHAPELARLPRAGIVHRLDADTSGVLVVARTAEAQFDLVRQLQARTVEREYWAVVLGRPPKSGTIDAAIGRDRRNPLRFRVSTASDSKPARTHYLTRRTIKLDGVALSWISCRLETGRTHQIRVHMEHLGFPLIGDPVYRQRLPARDATHLWRGFGRQALHAYRLGLIHPSTGVPMAWTRLPPADMARLMAELGFDADVRGEG